MKNAAKFWPNYLFTALGVLAIVGTGILIYNILGEPDWPLRYSWFFMIFGGVFVLLVGFIIQDLYRAWKRKILHDWDNPLPEEVVNKAWMIYFPLFCSGIISFLTGLIAFLITK